MINKTTLLDILELLHDYEVLGPWSLNINLHWINTSNTESPSELRFLNLGPRWGKIVVKRGKLRSDH